MPEWEYTVQSIAHSDNPYREVRYPSLEIKKVLQDLGKDGWELVHVLEIEGKWRSNPERFPGGDPGRCTWDNGTTILYFKRSGLDKEAR